LQELQFVGLVVTVLCFGTLSMLNSSYEVNTVEISLSFWLLAVGSGIMRYALYQLNMKLHRTRGLSPLFHVVLFGASSYRNGISILLYLTALQNLPVSHAAFYVALIPVFGVTSAILMIGEQPSLTQWVGAGLIITSSYFANRLRMV
jgi:drug/metabolite transporter (DMT)-like permease